MHDSRHGPVPAQLPEAGMQLVILGGLKIYAAIKAICHASCLTRAKPCHCMPTSLHSISTWSWSYRQQALRPRSITLAPKCLSFGTPGPLVLGPSSCAVKWCSCALGVPPVRQWLGRLAETGVGMQQASGA